MSRQVMVVLALSLLSAGCAVTTGDEQALERAREGFEAIKNDPDVLRSAPKDVIRAGESLARAERLSSYWGSSSDVAHYAYLSERYASIAREHSQANLNQEQAAKLALELQRLQLRLREMTLIKSQHYSDELDDQMIHLAASETDRGLVMTLGDVLFDTGRAELQPAANRTLFRLVQFLQLNPKRRVRVEGYTDTTGRVEDNLVLSQARAQSVADVLTDLGIDSSRIEVVGYGIEHPVAENASARGRAQNRRVEIVFSDENGQLSAPR